MDLDDRLENQPQPSRRQFLGYAAAASLAYVLGCGGNSQESSSEKDINNKGKKYDLDLSSPEKTAQHYLRFRFQNTPDYQGLETITLPEKYDNLKEFLGFPPKPAVEMAIEEENKAWFVEIRKTSHYRVKGENYQLPTAQVVAKIQLDKGTFSPFVNLIKKEGKWLITSVSH